ncbi:MAG: 3-isopropylmalate dehydratase [Candidatus Lokiarchaeota archaeon]|nr:3-isopropylmalate dehydratase [Candidatus Lokiarchaeota archaeon]
MGSKSSIKDYRDVIKGKVWVFPDNVDTDVISPGKYLDDMEATLAHTCDTLIPEFPNQVKDGDIIVAGRNFGCGSSRETAPIILQEKGIVSVVAESFARIFYRSSFARALPLLEIEGIGKEFKTGDEIEINIPNAEVKNLRTGKKFTAPKIPDILMDLLKNGGMEKQLLEELKAKGKAAKD